MNVLYLECSMGVAGDMLTAALLELVPNKQYFLDKINSFGLHGVKVVQERKASCGVLGTRVKVNIDGEFEESKSINDFTCKHDHDYSHSHAQHSSLDDVINIIKTLDISDKVKDDAVAIYNIIAKAESKVHGKEVKEIHFHEVGSLDAIIDIVSVCLLIENISPEKIIVSPINVGSGYVKCAHGVLPVPAPATSLILEKIPIYSNGIKSELCTPTGAALIKYFADEFCELPVLNVTKVGYGLGSKEFAVMNCVRAYLGECTESYETICELTCNIDDMTGEDIAFACNLLMEKGALDVFNIPSYMKKGRPGTMIVCLCRVFEKERFITLIFKYTTTLGVRMHICQRAVLSRKVKEKETEYGKVKVKEATGYGVFRCKTEFDDISKIAKREGKTIDYVRNIINK